jgi:hypothetical protein
VRFLSCEPLLGPLKLDHMDVEAAGHREWCQINALTGRHTDMARPCEDVPHLDWVIAGGESGGNARPWHPKWATSLRDQCAAAGVPFHWKQHGEWVPICYLDDSDNYYDPKYGNGKRDTDRYEAVPPKRRAVKTTVLQLDGSEEFAFPPGAMTCFKVGKKAAGRTLDGRLHDDFPTVATPACTLRAWSCTTTTCSGTCRGSGRSSRDWSKHDE